MLVHREHLLGLFVSLLTFYRKGALFSIPFGFYWIINTPDLINDLKIPEEKTSTIRTIHKAKGAEFESVLVFLDKIELLKLFLNPDINSNEDDIRILYVALSRAKDFLFIATPPLTATQRHQLEELGMKMVSKTVREEQLT
ncbi:3'-5' exonuclease [Geobacillus sp. DSP4a]|uniref:3'-5' exonuclease n=1 Tax=Geobacillus sp. DSP4a TaxID=2508873 RepID=UPI00067DD739|nr:3'-5' exonuclease [Geobacillus sp. DSP4a]AKU27048.1 hypothetical protein IB49_12100 [Geobacillus sp. LC300]